MRQVTTLIILLYTAGLAAADPITDPATIDGKAVLSSAEFSIVGGDLQIVLEFLGARSDYTPAQVLTGVAFDMTGANITTAGNTAMVNTGSTLYEPKGEGRDASLITDISLEWGLVSNAYLMGPTGPFDWAVTSTAFDGSYGGGSSTEFTNPGEIEPSSSGLNGGDFGMTNTASLGHGGTKNMWVVDNAVKITLTGSGINLDNIGNVTFFYGSSLAPGTPPDNPVPEPGTIALLGVGLVVLAFSRRLRK